MNINILKTPPTHEPLCNSVTLSGVTILKNGRYNLRHVGSKKVVVLPNGDITRISKRGSEAPETQKKKPGNPKVNTSNSCETDRDCSSIHCEKKTVKYSLKKSVIRHRILNFINQQPGTKELYFVTVTFPPSVSDKLAYKFFNQWLTVLRSTNLLKSYLWVAERQKVGTIHYHIAIPHKIYIPKANKAMVTILCNAVRKGELFWNLQAAKRYNGIDIAKNRNTKRITNFAVKKGQKSLVMYLTKYVTKNEGIFNHLAWHCSRDFSNLVFKISFTDKELTTCNFELWINDERMIETEHCYFFPWRSNPPPQLIEYLSNINRAITSFLSTITDFHLN